MGSKYRFKIYSWVLEYTPKKYVRVSKHVGNYIETKYEKWWG